MTGPASRTPRNVPRPLARRIAAPLYRLTHPGRARFQCPICDYEGPFRSKRDRRHAKCPGCGALERARLQFAVLEPLLAELSPDTCRALHLAPEPHLGHWLRQRFGGYVTGDLARDDVDCRLDVQRLPFANAGFDFVMASHVLEYPADDRRAMAEIRRVLRPGGIAVLPVPLMRERTRDLPRRDPVTRVRHEPGLDYFDRLREVFAVVREYRSTDVDGRFQPFVHAPTAATPAALVHAPGVRIDVVPVCYAASDR